MSIKRMLSSASVTFLNSTIVFEYLFRNNVGMDGTALTSHPCEYGQRHPCQWNNRIPNGLMELRTEILWKGVIWTNRCFCPVVPEIHRSQCQGMDELAVRVMTTFMCAHNCLCNLDMVVFVMWCIRCECRFGNPLTCWRAVTICCCERDVLLPCW